MTEAAPVFDQLNLVVSDMDATLAFYRLLGLEIPDTLPEWQGHHRSAAIDGDLDLDFDSVAFSKQWNAGAKGAAGPVIGFRLPTREAVDATYERMTKAGYAGRQPPWDAFRGARYAIVEDPDKNLVGLMSPPDRGMAYDVTPPPS